MKLAQFLHTRFLYTTLLNLVPKSLLVVVIQQLKYCAWPCKVTWSKNLVTFWKGTPHCISHLAKIYIHRHYVNGYIITLVCYVILRDYVIIWSCNFTQKSLNVSHHPAKFYSHRNCGCGDIWFSVCHEISKDHIIQFRSELVKWIYKHQLIITFCHPALCVRKSTLPSPEFFSQ